MPCHVLGDRCLTHDKQINELYRLFEIGDSAVVLALFPIGVAAADVSGKGGPLSAEALVEVQNYRLNPAIVERWRRSSMSANGACCKAIAQQP